MLLIPSIDLRGGQCVRLYQGDFAAETRYEMAPHELVLRYRALGASWVHIVDLDGAKDGHLANRSTIVALASQRALRLQVGGGVRTSAALDDLLRQGVDRVVIGSAAIERPAQVQAWLERYGPERLCLAFDVRLREGDEPLTQIHGWTEASTIGLWEAIEPYLAHGLRHVLCTDVERDGALAGPSFGLYEEAMRRFPQLKWQASGGVRSAANLASLARIGVAAAVSGRALLEQRLAPEELRAFLPNASFPASTSATAKS